VKFETIRCTQQRLVPFQLFETIPDLGQSRNLNLAEPGGVWAGQDVCDAVLTCPV